jgi:hypothetical protein
MNSLGSKNLATGYFKDFFIMIIEVSGTFSIDSSSNKRRSALLKLFFVKQRTSFFYSSFALKEIL